MNKKWYEKNLTIILMLIFVFPVGLFLMWKYSKWNKIISILVSLFFGITLIGNIGSVGKTSKDIQTNATVQEQSKEETVQEQSEENEEEEEQEEETIENTEGSIQTKSAQHTGTRQLGWIEEKGKWYYYDKDVKVKTGWIKDNGKWYYLNSDGTMATNKTVDGYYVASNGVMQEKSAGSQASRVDNNLSDTVWVVKNAKVYHSRKTCSNMKNPTFMTLKDAQKKGLKPCSKCH